MHILSSFLTLVLLDLALTCTIPKSLILHEKRDFDPSTTKWEKRSIAPRDLKLPVRIAVSQRNIENSHMHLMGVSDPESPKFGEHWTPQQVHDYFSPTPSTVLAIQKWLSSSGIEAQRHKVADSRGSIRFEASVDEAERLLGTRYDIWENSETGALTISCDHYHIPTHLKDHVDFITPTTGLDSPSSGKIQSKKHIMRQRLSKLSPSMAEGGNSSTNATLNLACADFMTPQCIRNLYGIPTNTKAAKGSELGIFECGDAYAQEDLDLFFSTFASNVPTGTHPNLQSIDGGTAPVPISNSGGESILDLDLAYPLVYPQSIKLFQTLDSLTASSMSIYGLFDIFLDALDGSFCTYKGGDNHKIDPSYPNSGYPAKEMCGTYHATPVLSLSYGLAEAYYPRKYIERQCLEYLKLGLLGTSIIVASGDNGTVSRAGIDGCLSSSRDNPTFPASCPWVTSVGATQLLPGSTTHETAVNPENAYTFSSGGGFSTVFPRPSYQENHVTAFLDSTQRNTSLFNPTGRGFPDVAANGWNIATVNQGYLSISAGTSASAPLFASMVSRIVGQRMASGKKRLGFLNPVLYAHDRVLRDVKSGWNLGCGGVPAFNATGGWDPVSGLGTGDFGRLGTLLRGLP